MSFSYILDVPHVFKISLQVDIFTLGTALYELMTLRGLPSNDINEMEYRNMLQTGTRPRFSPNVRVGMHFVLLVYTLVFL